MGRTLWLLVFLLPLHSFAQQKETTTPETCTVEGVVLRAGTDEPLRKALVMLLRVEGQRRPYTTTTDFSGRFLLKGFEPGRYRLRAHRNGYASQSYGAKRPGDLGGTTLTLLAGQTLRDITLRLVPAAVIAGRVADEDGEPMAGVQVEILRPYYERGKRQLTPFGWRETDDRGEYRAHGLAPGRYYLRATYRGEMRMGMVGGFAFSREAGDTSAEESYAPTYYPGTPDLSMATPVEVRAGEELTGIDFTLLTTRAVRIRGRVVNSITGQPGRGVNLMLVPRSAATRGFSYTNQSFVQDPQGEFEIPGVTPGSYSLYAMWWDGDRGYSARAQIEVANSDIEGIQLVIGRGTELRGRVRVEGGELDLSNDLIVSLESAVEGIVFGGQAGRIRKDGTFSLSNVAEGEYFVQIGLLPEGSYLKSVRMGGEELADGRLVVGEGQAGGNLEIVISAAGGRVEGVVADENGAAVAGALVVLVPEPSRRAKTRWYQTSTTDQYGQFSLKGVEPGEYQLFAWDHVESGAYQDDEFLRPYEEHAVAVRVEEGSQQVVQLRLIESGDAER
jgi:protocatechuate 3,4-dioxygenase beta subunit